MFHDIPSEIIERMNYLENRDKNEMSGQVNIKHFNKLRQIPPETGQFISLLAANSPKGQWLEIGTSGGYSTLWLSLACKQIKTKITTFELEPEKIALAKESFSLAQVEEYIDLIPGDVFEYLPNYTDVSYVFWILKKSFMMIVMKPLSPIWFLVAFY